MQVREVINGILVLVVFAISMAYVARAESSMPIFTIALSNNPLKLYPLPLQQAKANSSFTLNLKPFINVIKPEIDYQVTNNASRTLDGIVLIELPNGLTRIYDGDNVCAESFTLGPHSSCTLRFNVDKSRYVHSLRGGPIVCYRPGIYCYRPDINAQIDDAVMRAPDSTQILISPKNQDGLEYDPTTESILGKPARTGLFHFTLAATNGISTTDPQSFSIDVDINPHDKPIFKRHYSLASAMPEHNYRLNLMDLIESTPEFSVTNQVSFRIDLEKNPPSWLSLDNEKATVLQGSPPLSDAGQIKKVTLIATSNTGGDSLPMTIQIPVAFDREKRPVIENGIELHQAIGDEIHADLRANIADPTADASLKLVLDNVEPAAPWLLRSTSNLTELDGVVPQSAVGQLYQLTLHANNAIGGDSDRVTIPLQIAIDKSKTPYFYSDKPQLPIFYAGQAYFYDFVTCNDVIPTYSDIPYVVELAKGYNNPEWLRIEDNKLIVDNVPEQLKANQKLFITIKNIPGGISEVLPMSLVIMG